MSGISTQFQLKRRRLLTKDKSRNKNLFPQINNYQKKTNNAAFLKLLSSKFKYSGSVEQFLNERNPDCVKIFEEEDPKSYKDFLNDLNVCINEECKKGKVFQNMKGLDQSQLLQAQLDLIKQARRLIFEKHKNRSLPRNVLCWGYKRRSYNYRLYNKAPQLGDLLQDKGIYCCYPSSGAMYLVENDFLILLSRIGDDLMLYLLRSATLIIKTKNDCYIQLTGTPIFDLSSTWFNNKEVSLNDPRERYISREKTLYFRTKPTKFLFPKDHFLRRKLQEHEQEKEQEYGHEHEQEQEKQQEQDLNIEQDEINEEDDLKNEIQKEIKSEMLIEKTLQNKTNKSNNSLQGFIVEKLFLQYGGLSLNKQDNCKLENILKNLKNNYKSFNWRQAFNRYLALPKNWRNKPLSELVTMQTPLKTVMTISTIFLKKILPIELFGTKKNLKNFCSGVRKYLQLKIKEEINIKEISEPIFSNCNNIVWISNIILQEKKEKNLAIIILWLYEEVISIFLSRLFYFTDTVLSKKRVVFYRREIWSKIETIFFEKFKKTHLKRITFKSALEILEQNKLGYARIRLLPKKNGIRPIMNLSKRKKMNHNHDNNYYTSVNKRLKIIFELLTYERKKNPTPYGASVFGNFSISKKFYDFAKRRKINKNNNTFNTSSSSSSSSSSLVTTTTTSTSTSSNSVNYPISSSSSSISLSVPHKLRPTPISNSSSLKIPKGNTPPMTISQNTKIDLQKYYFVSVDVEKCFDSIPQEKMIEILNELIQEESYSFKNFLIYSQIGSKFKVKKKIWVSTGDKIPNFFELINNIYSKKYLDTLFVDQVYINRICKNEIIDLVSKHIKQSLIKLSGQFYIQKRGIPQGSVLSTLLSSIFYGNFERTVLAEYLNHPDSLLIRMIDDFFFITPKKDLAISFLKLMLPGFQEYGISINSDKIKTSFSCVIDKKIITKNVDKYFKWCKLLINIENLSIYENYENFSWQRLSNSVLIHYTSVPSIDRINIRIRSTLQNRCAKMFFSQFINDDIHPIISNMYKLILVIIMKFVLIWNYKNVKIIEYIMTNSHKGISRIQAHNTLIISILNTILNTLSENILPIINQQSKILWESDLRGIVLFAFRAVCRKKSAKTKIFLDFLKSNLKRINIKNWILEIITLQELNKIGYIQF
ncbi:telomerase reverse transcriptase [Anaeramoeba flamelloides]|uniref:Telomerase reverse transcriptase n=1 Tax=Anaeramoeba flamelloides TaxID=1746091 RepID=A0AAV7Z4J2_9EUKA|nr:telomerase reverse transcriptase [Anaeramoeba flamelloides]